MKTYLVTIADKYLNCSWGERIEAESRSKAEQEAKKAFGDHVEIVSTVLVVDSLGSILDDRLNFYPQLADKISFDSDNSNTFDEVMQDEDIDHEISREDKEAIEQWKKELPTRKYFVWAHLEEYTEETGEAVSLDHEYLPVKIGSFDTLEDAKTLMSEIED